MEAQIIALPPPTAAIRAGTTAAESNAAVVYIASLAAGSRRSMTDALTRIACILCGVDPAATTPATRAQYLLALPWGDLRYQHTAAVRARLAELYSARTANRCLAALRGTLKTAWRLGQMSADDSLAARDIQNIAGEHPDQAAGRALRLGEIHALMLACCDDTPGGARDAALVAVAYSCGLRRAELAGLQVGDLRDGVLTVRGKRNKTRTVPLSDGAAAALADWLAVRGSAPGALFVRITKSGRILGDGLTPAGIRSILAKRGDAAGVDTFTPHDLRRTFAGDLLDAGADLSVVQKLMGHADAGTTAGYDRRGERAKQDAVRRLHVPYQSPAKSK